MLNLYFAELSGQDDEAMLIDINRAAVKLGRINHQQIRHYFLSQAEISDCGLQLLVGGANRWAFRNGNRQFVASRANLGAQIVKVLFFLEITNQILAVFFRGAKFELGPQNV